MVTHSNDWLALVRVFRDLNVPAGLTNLALHDAARVLDHRLSVSRLGRRDAEAATLARRAA